MAAANATESTQKWLTDILRGGSVKIVCDPSMLIIGNAIERSLRTNMEGLDVKIVCQRGAGQPHITLPDGKEIVGFFIVEELKKAALAKPGSND